MLCVYLLLLYFTKTATEQCEAKVFVNIISERYPRDPKAQKIDCHVHNLSAIYESNGVPSEDISFWSPIIAHSCDIKAWSNVRDGMKSRGSNLAHKEIWDKHIRKRRSCDINKRDQIIIHEYDAFLGNLDTVTYALKLVKNMTTDFLYLGYCYEKPNNRHKLHGMDEFYKMNLTTKDVKTLSDWQFRQYTEQK